MRFLIAVVLIVPGTFYFSAVDNFIGMFICVIIGGAIIGAGPGDPKPTKALKSQSQPRQEA